MRRLLSCSQFSPCRFSPPGLRLLLASFLLLWFSPPLLRAASFTATLDRQTVTVGESATLSLTFEGGDPETAPTLPPIPNLQITGQTLPGN